MNESIEMRWEQANEAGRRLFSAGDLPRAEEQFRIAIQEAERIGGDSVQLASSLSNLGQLKYQQRDFTAAETFFARSLSIRERALGAEHHSVVHSINNLAALYVARGDLEKAEPLFLKAMGITERRLQSTQGDLAVNLNNLARLYFKRNDYVSAEPLLERLLALKLPLGETNVEVAGVLTSLARLRHALGRYEEAEELWHRIMHVREVAGTLDDPAVAPLLESYADTCAAQSKFDSALALRQRALVIREQALGADSPSVAAARAKVAELAGMVGGAAPASVPVPAAEEPIATASPADEAAPAEAYEDAAPAGMHAEADAPHAPATPVDLMPVPPIVHEMVADARNSGAVRAGEIHQGVAAFNDAEPDASLAEEAPADPAVTPEPGAPDAAQRRSQPRWPAEFEMPSEEHEALGVGSSLSAEPEAPQRRSSLAMAQLPALEIRGATPGATSAVSPSPTSAPVVRSPRSAPPFSADVPMAARPSHAIQWSEPSARPRDERVPSGDEIELGVVAPPPAAPAAPPPPPRRTIAESRPLRKPNMQPAASRGGGSGRWIIIAAVVLLGAAATVWALTMRGRGGENGAASTADTTSNRGDAKPDSVASTAPPVETAPAPAPAPTRTAEAPRRSARQAAQPESAVASADSVKTLPPPVGVKPPSIDLSKVDSAIAGRKPKLDSSAKVPVPPPTFKKP